jgi:hypothetical protein
MPCSEIIRQRRIGGSLDMDQYALRPAAAPGTLEYAPCGTVDIVQARVRCLLSNRLGTNRAGASEFDIPALWQGMRSAVYEFGVMPKTHSCPRLTKARDSDVDDDLQAGLLKLILEGRELVGELSEFAIVEFRKDKFVQGFLLGGQVCDVLV